MELLQQIKHNIQLSNLPKNNILKEMGYSNLKIAQQRLSSLLTTGLYNWLKHSQYDFKYTNKEFLIKLCSVLNISNYEPKIEQLLNHINYINTLQQPYIYVYTNFKRTSEQIFVLALMEGSRNIYLNKEAMYSKTDVEISSIVSKIITEHYREHNGKLAIWRKILSYVYHHTNENKYVFNTKGELIESTPPSQSKAQLFIGNKIINS